MKRIIGKIVMNKNFVQVYQNKVCIMRTTRGKNSTNNFRPGNLIRNQCDETSIHSHYLEIS